MKKLQLIVFYFFVLFILGCNSSDKKKETKAELLEARFTWSDGEQYKAICEAKCFDCKIYLATDTINPIEADSALSEAAYYACINDHRKIISSHITNHSFDNGTNTKYGFDRGTSSDNDIYISVPFNDSNVFYFSSTFRTVSTEKIGSSFITSDTVDTYEKTRLLINNWGSSNISFSKTDLVTEILLNTSYIKNNPISIYSINNSSFLDGFQTADISFWGADETSGLWKQLSLNGKKLTVVSGNINNISVLYACSQDNNSRFNTGTVKNYLNSVYSQALVNVAEVMDINDPTYNSWDRNADGYLNVSSNSGIEYDELLKEIKRNYSLSYKNLFVYKLKNPIRCNYGTVSVKDAESVYIQYGETDFLRSGLDMYLVFSDGTNLRKRIYDIRYDVIYFEGSDSTLVKSGRIIDAYVDGVLSGFSINHKESQRIEYVSVLAPSAGDWTIAHELGHILLNGAHTSESEYAGELEKNNLMYYSESGGRQTQLRHRKLWYGNDYFSQWEHIRENLNKATVNNTIRNDL